MMHKRKSLGCLFVLLIVLSSCSASDEQEVAEDERGLTEEIAQEAVERIQSPLNKARLVREVQERHNREVEESAEEK